MPVDPRAMFLSTLQLVLVPVLAGAAVNQFFPKVQRGVSGLRESRAAGTVRVEEAVGVCGRWVGGATLLLLAALGVI